MGSSYRSFKRGLVSRACSKYSAWRCSATSWTNSFDFWSFVFLPYLILNYLLCFAGLITSPLWISNQTASMFKVALRILPALSKGTDADLVWPLLRDDFKLPMLPCGAPSWAPLSSAIVGSCPGLVAGPSTPLSASLATWIPVAPKSRSLIEAEGSKPRPPLPLLRSDRFSRPPRLWPAWCPDGP